MKIVIEVPEEEYNTRQLIHYFGCYSDKLDLVIYNGTPLPKGYGRLIDADSIISEINKRIEKCREEHGCYGNSYDARCFNLYNIVIDIINNAQIANIERGDEDV